ncbi:hypothetical protein [Nitrosococcus oceani]|nr:hypothetical protein [Nitrosococcus oceani]
MSVQALTVPWERIFKRTERGSTAIISTCGGSILGSVVSKAGGD